MIVEAKDFAGETPTGYRFGGGSREQIVAGVAKLVDAIADGRALVTAVHVKAEVTVDEYLYQELTIRYAEHEGRLSEEHRIPVEKVRELFGNHPFPVAIVKTTAGLPPRE